MMMWMFPPAPTPFPLPSKAQTFWAFCLCQGWGWVGAKGEFGIGNWLPPPLPPFPWHNFFRGVPREGGLREALRCLDLPRSLPHLSTPGSSRSWRGLDSWGREAGGGGRYEVPTPTLPPRALTYEPPLTPPSPPEPLPWLSASDLFFKANLAESTWVVRVGAGAWGVEPSINPTLPNSCEGRPPPLGYEGGRWARPSPELGGVGVMDGFGWAGQGLLPWLCCLHPSPQTPPPLLHHPAPDFRTSRSRDARKSGAGWRRRGKGLGAQHTLGWDGSGFHPLYLGRGGRRRWKPFS